VQHPEIFSMCESFPYADAADFSSSSNKNSLLGKLSCEERNKVLAQVTIVFSVFLQKSLPNKEVVLVHMMKNCQHQHKGKQYI
jgi:hypothetical protein